MDRSDEKNGKKGAVLAPDGFYAPGPIRSSSDGQRALIEGFLWKHPEFSKLGDLEITTLMATYRDDEDQERRDVLFGEGVPLDWSREEDGDENAPSNSDYYY